MDTYWRRLILWLSIAVLGYFLLFFGMGTLVPNFSANEIATQGSATSLSAIWHDPLMRRINSLSGYRSSSVIIAYCGLGHYLPASHS